MLGSDPAGTGMMEKIPGQLILAAFSPEDPSGQLQPQFLGSVFRQLLLVPSHRGLPSQGTAPCPAQLHPRLGRGRFPFSGGFPRELWSPFSPAPRAGSQADPGAAGSSRRTPGAHHGDVEDVEQVEGQGGDQVDEEPGGHVVDADGAGLVHHLARVAHVRRSEIQGDICPGESKTALSTPLRPGQPGWGDGD